MGERIDVDFNTSAALRALEDLNKRVDTLSKKAKGLSVGGALNAASNAGIGGATGQAIASFASSSTLEKIATVVEAIGTRFMPELMAKLDVLGPRQAAFHQIAGIAEQGGRLGVSLPDQVLASMRDQAVAAEQRAAIQRARVRSSAFQGAEADAARGVAGSDLNQKFLEKFVDLFGGPQNR